MGPLHADDACCAHASAGFTQASTSPEAARSGACRGWPGCSNRDGTRASMRLAGGLRGRSGHGPQSRAAELAPVRGPMTRPASRRCDAAVRAPVRRPADPAPGNLRSPPQKNNPESQGGALRVGVEPKPGEGFGSVEARTRGGERTSRTPLRASGPWMGRKPRSSNEATVNVYQRFIGAFSRVIAAHWLGNAPC